jgi:PAS domain S-box-containing protein
MDLVVNLNANLCFGSQSIARTTTSTAALQNPSVAGVTGVIEDDAYAEMESAQHIRPPQQQSQQRSCSSSAEMGFLTISDGKQKVYESEVYDFTKEQGWSQSVLRELRDFLHVITPDGRILYASPSCCSITGYEPQSLIGELIGKYVHPDDNDTFIRELQESLASGNALRFFYRFIREDGTCVILECNGHPHISFTAGISTQSSEAEPPVPLFTQAAAGACLGFFITARPYRNKVNALLDSALELKMEHERLVYRVKKLRREEARETMEQYRLRRDQSSSRIGARTSGLQSKGSRGSSNPGDAPDSMAGRLQLRRGTMQARKPALSSYSVLSARGQDAIGSGSCAMITRQLT